MQDAFVVIATFWGVVEAKMASEVLASAGIGVRLADDGIAAANPFLAPAIGGVRVLVAPQDVERANELLELRGLTPGGEPPPVDFGSLEDEAMQAEPADESVGKFLEAQKKRR